jgi:hypothetical protein
MAFIFNEAVNDRTFTVSYRKDHYFIELDKQV